MWVGGMAHSQKKGPTPQKKITLKIAIFARISPFVFPNLTKTLGWVNTFGKYLPKNVFLFNAFP